MTAAPYAEPITTPEAAIRLLLLAEAGAFRLMPGQISTLSAVGMTLTHTRDLQTNCGPEWTDAGIMTDMMTGKCSVTNDAQLLGQIMSLTHDKGCDYLCGLERGKPAGQCQFFAIYRHNQPPISRRDLNIGVAALMAYAELVRALR